MVLIHGQVKYYTIWLTEQGEVKIRVQDKQARTNSNRQVVAFIPGSDRRLKRFPDLQLYYDDYHGYGFSDQEASWMTGAIAATESINDYSMAMAQLFALTAALVAQGYQLTNEIVMERNGPEAEQSIFLNPYQNVVFRNPVTSVTVTHQQLAEVEDQADQFRTLVTRLMA